MTSPTCNKLTHKKLVILSKQYKIFVGFKTIPRHTMNQCQNIVLFLIHIMMWCLLLDFSKMQRRYSEWNLAKGCVLENNITVFKKRCNTNNCLGNIQRAIQAARFLTHTVCDGGGTQSVCMLIPLKNNTMLFNLCCSDNHEPSFALNRLVAAIFRVFAKFTSNTVVCDFGTVCGRVSRGYTANLLFS